MAAPDEDAMIYLLYGDDELTLEETLASLKESVGPEELRDVNINNLDGSRVDLEELVATCSTVPFLSERRLVVVRGLLGRFEPRRPRQGGRTSGEGAGDDSRLGQWEGLAEALSGMPPTTDLALVDAGVSQTNPLARRLRPMAEVQAFPAPARDELRRWIEARAARRGVAMDPRAVNALAEAVGGDTRVLDTELQKLSLYCRGETVRAEDVDQMVSYVKEANIFTTVDAVLEGRPGLAIRSVHQLLDAGRPATYLITMLARQVRLLLLAKDLKSQGVPGPEIGNRLSLSGYPLRKTLEQEGRFSEDRLVWVHRRLLETDLEIKSTGTDEQTALEALIVGLASRPAAPGTAR